MKFGLILIAVGVVWYIVHAVIYNYYFQKNDPGLFDNTGQARDGKKGGKKVTVVVTSGTTPAWVMALGMPPVPLFLIGIVITVIAFVIGLFT